MYKNILWPFLILISACSNETKYIDEKEEIITGHMINSILQLSECLSINASPGEKFGITQANLITADIRDREAHEKYIKQSQEDFDFMIDVAKKKCPSSLNTAIESIYTAKSPEAKSYLEIILQDIVVSGISSQILSLEEKKEAFRTTYQPLGKNKRIEELY